MKKTEILALFIDIDMYISNYRLYELSICVKLFILGVLKEIYFTFGKLYPRNKEKIGTIY